nr:hypothetical protein [uncultured Sphingomonas sp.]
MAIPLRRNAPDRTRLLLFALNEAGAEVPMNLSGYDLRLQIRLYQGALGAPLLDLSTSTGLISIANPAQGEVEIDWPAVQDAIEALPSTAEAGDPTRPRIDTFAYDLMVIAPDGVSQIILEGPVPVAFGVTRNG